jgi:hypothetical protein
MARTSNNRSLTERLDAIRAGAPRRSPTVRALASYSGHADCNLATLGFTARVDFDRLLAGTEYEAPFGQSPFAFARGLRFERILADRGYAATLELLRTSMGFGISDARIVSLRNLYAKNAHGMSLRAQDTRVLVRQLIKGDANAPNLIDGAVLEAAIGGVPARFEADAIAARFGGPIHAGELKSFPVVDERADPEKLASALDQVAIYILLTKWLIAELKGDPNLVSTTAMLITPKNVGLTPTLSRKDVGSRVIRVERMLNSVPRASDIADALPSNMNFRTVADTSVDVNQRVDALHDIADTVGTAYNDTCLSTCGNAVFCRERAFREGSPCMSGGQLVRLLPGIRSLRRAAELTDGAPPVIDEAPVASHLARAGRLYDSAVNQTPKAKSKGKRAAR